MFQYTIHPDSEIPVYRQLADQINAEIRSGALKTGEKLPTVREMAQQMHLSCGTVKRVYDRLAELGDIEMTRRRGTFVKYVRENADSRKLQAMAAIDRMLRQMANLNFSPAEIQIFVGLKMREWSLRWSGVRLAVVTPSGRLTPSLRRQLETFSNVQADAWPTAQMIEYPYNAEEQSDLILADVSAAARIAPQLSEPNRLVRVAYGLTPQSRRDAARLAQPGALLATADEELARLVRGELSDALSVCTPEEIVNRPDFSVLAVGEDEAESGHLAAILSELRGENRLVSLSYRLDDGTMIHLEERIRRIREERQQQPGSAERD